MSAVQLNDVGDRTYLEPADDPSSELERLARDLHDVVGQDLTAIQLSLLAARQITNPAELGSRLDLTVALTEHALADVRAIASDLRRPDPGSAGLSATVLAYLDEIAAGSGVSAELHAVELGRLPRSVELAALRIVREAVTNAIRHARPRRIDVRLDREPGRLVVQVTDDGSGFDVLAAISSPKALGLRGMYERASLSGGWIEFRTEPVGGTTVVACLPLVPVA